jgi:hypothetical protein
MIKKYQMEIVEKLRGTIQVQAEDEAQAYCIAKRMLSENGGDRLFYPVSGVDDDLYPYKGDLWSTTQSVEDCKEIARC